MPARDLHARRHWSLSTDDPTTAAHARRAFRVEIERYAVADSDVAGAELIFAELLSNVVRHASGPATVWLTWPCSRPTLFVLDGGGGFLSPPHPSLPDATAEHGRGLAMVAALAVGMRAGNRPCGGAYVCAVLPVSRLEPVPVRHERAAFSQSG